MQSSKMRSVPLYTEGTCKQPPFEDSIFNIVITEHIGTRIWTSRPVPKSIKIASAGNAPCEYLSIVTYRGTVMGPIGSYVTTPFPFTELNSPMIMSALKKKFVQVVSPESIRNCPPDPT